MQNNGDKQNLDGQAYHPQVRQAFVLFRGEFFRDHGEPVGVFPSKKAMLEYVKRQHPQFKRNRMACENDALLWYDADKASWLRCTSADRMSYYV